MTRLEKKRRRQSRSWINGNNLKDSVFKRGVVAKPRGPKLNWHSLTRLVQANNRIPEITNKMPEIDANTAKVIQVEVEDLLIQRGGSVNVAAMAGELVRSNWIRNTFAGETSQWPSTSRYFPFWNKKKSGEMLQKKYALADAFGYLEKSSGASDRWVGSWEQARELLSTYMIFPTTNDAAQDAVGDPGGRSDWNPLSSIVRFRKVLEDIATRDLTPSEEKYRKIRAHRVPDKLGDEKQREADAWTMEMDATYAQREETRASQIAQEVEQRMLEKEREEEAMAMASSLLRDYTDYEEAIIEEALYGGGRPDEVVKSEGTDTVQRISMHKLQPGQWLNDEVIHFFYVMLAKRDEGMCAEDPKRKRSHFFKSFFMTKLLNEGHTDPNKEGTFDYKQVKRWSKKVPGKDIFNLDKVFFPINVSSMHWVCAVAFIQEKRIQFYDSFGSPGTHYLRSIFRYLQEEHLDKKKSPLPDADQWRLVECTPDTPTQGNGYDCGVFTCMFADFIAKDCPLLFTQEHVNQCRKRIALSIMLGKAIL